VAAIRKLKAERPNLSVTDGVYRGDPRGMEANA
jgi:hypothetical protein